jgi:Secretion system C-terminal sorting domain
MKKLTYTVVLIFFSVLSLRAQPLDSPILSEPPDVDIIVLLPVTLEWNSVTGAETYEIQISLNSDFSTLISPTPYSIAATSFQVPIGVLNPFTVYYWRVRALNSLTTSEYSTARNFRTAGTPAQEIQALEDVVSNLQSSNSLNPIQVHILNQRLNVALLQCNLNHMFQCKLHLLLFDLRVYVLIFSQYLDFATGQSLVANANEIIGLINGDNPSAEIDLSPKEYTLNQNYPNPFNPTTNIEYTIPKDGNVNLKVYDIEGREVATLVDKYQNAGSYITMWDASNFSSGVYFYRIISGSYVETKRMVLKK